MDPNSTVLNMHDVFHNADRYYSNNNNSADKISERDVLYPKQQNGDVFQP